MKLKKNKFSLTSLINSFLRYLYNLPKINRRLILIFIDLFLVNLSIEISAYFYPDTVSINYFNYAKLLVFLSPIIFILTGQYRPITLYVGSTTIYMLIIRNTLLILITYLFSILFNFPLLSIKNTILIFLFLNVNIGFYRFLIRDFLSYLQLNNIKNTKVRKKVIIYGAGAAGAQLSASLKFKRSYIVKYFVDDNLELIGRSIDCIPIKSSREINYDEDIDFILLAIPSLTRSQRKKLIERLQNTKINLLEVPSLKEITSGSYEIDSLRPIEIEELLGRSPIDPDPNLLGPGVSGKNILVTGAGGSIGSELCRQICELKPTKIVLLDNSEHNLYKINEELRELFALADIEIFTILGSTTRKILIQSILKDYKIEVIFHASAYKHVPIVEANPLAGIYNNVFSTELLCDLAVKNEVKNFILISTDKAVRPTNIMGASKRLAELIVIYFSKKSVLTKFSLVRFGNVLGSSGSVVPRFKEQISKGGPITITDPKVIRYFMTIQEASQLVIQSVALAEGGDIFLLEMGEPVPIIDLAKQMINLSGLKIKNNQNIDGDIEIIQTGLRPGEKLYEELIVDGESIPTKHPRIYRANESKGRSPYPSLNLLRNFIKEDKTEEAKNILLSIIS